MKSDSKEIIIGVLVFLAACFSIGSVTWCETVDFTLRGIFGNREVSFGLWRYHSFVLVASSSGELWKVETCRGYPDEVEKDSFWKAAQAFSIIAPVWGVFSICPLFMAAEIPTMVKLSGACLLLAALFQGLTLLVLNSDLCDATQNPLFDSYPILQASGALTTQEECAIGRSAIITIVSTCLWFVAGAVTLVEPTATED